MNVLQRLLALVGLGLSGISCAEVKRQLGYADIGTFGVAADPHALSLGEVPITLFTFGTAADGDIDRVGDTSALGHLNIAPTAQNPLAGLESFSQSFGGPSFNLHNPHHAILATPLLNFNHQPLIPKGVTFEQGWQGLDHGVGVAPLQKTFAFAQPPPQKQILPLSESTYEVVPAVQNLKIADDIALNGFNFNSLSSNVGFGSDSGSKDFASAPGILTLKHQPQGHSKYPQLDSGFKGFVSTAAPHTQKAAEGGKLYSFQTTHSKPGANHGYNSQGTRLAYKPTSSSHKHGSTDHGVGQGFSKLTGSQGSGLSYSKPSSNSGSHGFSSHGSNSGFSKPSSSLGHGNYQQSHNSLNSSPLKSTYTSHNPSKYSSFSSHGSHSSDGFTNSGFNVPVSVGVQHVHSTAFGSSGPGSNLPSGSGSSFNSPSPTHKPPFKGHTFESSFTHGTPTPSRGHGSHNSYSSHTSPTASSHKGFSGHGTSNSHDESNSYSPSSFGTTSHSSDSFAHHGSSKPLSHQGSTHVASGHGTNGHGGGSHNDHDKATSFQSFIIHSYKAVPVYHKKTEYKSAQSQYHHQEPENKQDTSSDLYNEDASQQDEETY